MSSAIHYSTLNEWITVAHVSQDGKMHGTVKYNPKLDVFAIADYGKSAPNMDFEAGFKSLEDLKAHYKWVMENN